MDQNKLITIIAAIIWWVLIILALYFFVNMFDFQNNSQEVHPLIQSEMQLYELSGSYQEYPDEIDYNQWDYPAKNYQSSQNSHPSTIDFWMQKVDIQEENIVKWQELLPE